MIKEIAKLKNNIEYLYRKNENTPRMAICLNFSINKPEVKPGVYSLMARLLLQGTKNYNSEELANEFEKYAIDFSSEYLSNCLKLKVVCLNEDFSKALDLLYEVIQNSTFQEFEKERLKLKCEIPAELDSPRTTVLDKYSQTIFENHYYGNTLSLILQNIDTITKEDVIEAYKYILASSKKCMAVVGALDKEEFLPQLENTIGQISPSVDSEFLITKPELKESKRVEIERPDLNQAHIVKGWLVPSFEEEEHLPLILLNIILGACGLSSRLFLELRDKKGLAYVVRSSYESVKLAGSFIIYIATEPNNIEVSLKGFDEEIEKIKTIPVSEKELEDAKNNLIGKYAFLEETNIQQACTYAKSATLGLGFDFVDKTKEQIKDVTSEQILKCAQKCFNDKYVIAIIKP